MAAAAGAKTDILLVAAGLSAGDVSNALAKGQSLNELCTVALVQIVDLTRTLKAISDLATDVATKSLVTTALANLA